MSDPIAQQLPRRGRGTHLSEYPTADGESPGPASWTEVEKALRAGDATSWLSTRSPAGVHTRPLFAAWTGTSFVFATKSSAAKTAHMDADGRVSLAVDLHTLHLVVEGTVERLTSEAELTRASTALLKVYGWPTTVVGGELDAAFGAPTSGGPPYRAYELVPSRAFAFPTDDQVEPTRFIW